MSFIQRELNKISFTLCKTPYGLSYRELYAAQQALAWALEPDGTRSPFQMIMGTHEGSTGYPVESNPASS